jgi:hypothetical protein
MIVIRCYETLALPAIQLEVHSQCCTSGTCQKPDERHYGSTHSKPWGPITLAHIYCELIHEELSAHDDQSLSEVMSGHLGANRTS